MVQAVREYGNVINDRGRRNLFVTIYFLSVLAIIIAPFTGKVLIFVAALLFAFSLISLPNTYCYSLLYGLFPFANIFKLSPESLSFLTICEILLLLRIVLEQLMKHKPIKCNIALLFGLTLTVLHIILFSSQIDYLSIIKLIVRVLLVAYYLRAISSCENRLQSIKMVGYSFSVSMLIMMLLSQNSAYMDAVSSYLRIVQYDSSGALIRNGGLMDDPNYCSLAIMVSLTFLTVLYYYKLVKNVYWLLGVPLFLLGFTTYSKSYFLTAAVFLILLLLLVLFPKHKFLATVLCVIIVGVVSAIMRGQIEIINQILLRFDTVGIYTGRDELNQRYLGYIFENIRVLFFGEGFDSTSLPGVNNVHNLYIEMLFRLGTIGSLFFLITIIGCFPKKHTKSKLVNYIPAIFVVVMYMALAGMDSYGLFYYILLAGVSVFYIRDVNKDSRIIM